MKRRFLFATLLVVAAIVVAVVSCKKDNENALRGNNNETSRSIDLRQIDDIGAYLTDFRQKMLESKGGEALSLEDAAWHLASLANYEHCNINVHFDDVRFDTIYMQVNIVDDSILISDLRMAYEQMWPTIQKFEKGLNLDNQNLRFINMFISNDGEAKIALMTTFFSAEKYLGDRFWYFPSTTGYLDSICSIYIDEDEQYLWSYDAIRVLTTAINVYEGNRYTNPQSSCYIPTRSHDFYYYAWRDPYGSTFYDNSRLYAGEDFYYELLSSEMCYCLDSYLGLGCDYLLQDPGVDNEYPINWYITSSLNTPTPNTNIYSHKLTVQYGQLYLIPPGPNPQ